MMGNKTKRNPEYNKDRSETNTFNGDHSKIIKKSGTKVKMQVYITGIKKEICIGLRF